MSNYRMNGRSLFKLDVTTNTYIHVAIVPLHVCGLAQAVTWYESIEIEVW